MACLAALCVASHGCAEPDGGEGDGTASANSSAVPQPGADQALLQRLSAFEEQQRRGRTWVGESPGAALGSDPYRLVTTHAGGSTAHWGLLRRPPRLVKLDPQGNELQSYPAPAGAIAIGAGDGGLLLAGELSRELLLYPIGGERLAEARRLELTEPAVLRGLAYQGGHWYATEELSGQLVRLNISAGQAGAAARSVSLEPLGQCNGGLQLEPTAHWLVANCLLDHTLLIYSAAQLRAASAKPPAAQRFQLQGPIWGFALWERDDALGIAAGGVENAPLDRSIGSFGNIDSFVYVANVASAGIQTVAQVNVSELGVVVPKALAVSGEGEARLLRIAGYATSGVLHAKWSPEGLSDLELRDQTVPPGTAAMVASDGGLLLANTLLDSWLSVNSQGQVSPAHQAANEHRGPSLRLGEALFFTTLMAPSNQSTGKLSRFTCETCHFEGQTDGRIHSTGRGTIHATTKSLVGLVANRPYFTRALDPSLARMVHSEFRVAGANSGTDPRFSLELKRADWLRELGVGAAVLQPIELREALLEFLVHFNHGPHPALAQRAQPAAFNDSELRGAQLFEQRCEGCHQARRLADDPHSRVEPNQWLKELSAGGALVWARAGYEKVGVLPYVHPDGARPSSLRRLYKKAPYFTNGFAKTLESVLAACTFPIEAAGPTESSAEFSHQTAPLGWRHLSAQEQTDLLAFIRLL